MDIKQIVENYGTTNQWQIDGDVVQFENGVATIKVVTRGRTDSYENLLQVEIPESLAEQVKPGSMQSFVGQYVCGADETEPKLVAVDETEPKLVAVDVDAADDYFCLAQAIVKLAGGEFFKAQPKQGKKQFLSLFGDQIDGKNTITAVAFRALSQSWKNLAKGSVLLLGGQLRRKAFADNSGRFSTDIILDADYCDVIHEAKAKGIRKVGKSAKKSAKSGKGKAV